MNKILLALMIMLVCTTASAQIPAGGPAPEISLPNVNDSVVSLSSLKGKVVLVDFWASWCAPCRQSIPSIVRLYNKYKDKGFEVLAVSIDEEKKDWQKAMKYFRMKYISLVDTTGWASKIAAAYAVEGIPASFLIDQSGKIVAVDAQKIELEKKVKELLQ